MNKKVWLIVFLQIVLVISLFLYSYTQVDLGLTLNQSTYLFTIQRAFQSIGYFQRPLSTTLFVIIQTGLTLTYLGFICLAYKKKLSWRTINYLVILQTIFLAFSYNAFSYDLFNYIFYTKIITVYKANPYVVRALDFPQDPMLGFMRWTHNTYPYGPVWLVLTTPIAFVAKGYFIVNFFLFKLFMALNYLGCFYLVKKISDSIRKTDSNLPAVIFAFSPLVMIESLVSSHNDIVMFFFALSSLYLIIKKRYILSLIVLFLSIGIKFATIFLTPIYAYLVYLSLLKSKINWDKIIQYIIILMLGGVVAASVRTNLQPWYLLYVIPFVAISRKFNVLNISVIIFSIGIGYYYGPYLYYGNWDEPVKSFISYYPVALGISSIVIGSLMYLYREKILGYISK